SGIEVALDLDDALPLVVVDPVQAENALLNLAINARDAMPGGGTLTFSTRAEAGRVVLTVAGTGVGMPTAVRDRALEPFFTTKGVGQGSGLGLAQVYGFTTQSGGEIELESAEHVGTRIMITLPAVEGNWNGDG
ncbi:sensor histidine kinase, partial [Polymorphobacter multimanifer]|uniref:sensor histidine kinase n=1 Tax=Polymorphobacter multimanifer TaxID=1070431 RepID=UPI001FB13628